MANEGTTVVLGIPISSTNAVFLAIVGVHVRACGPDHWGGCDAE